MPIYLTAMQLKANGPTVFSVIHCLNLKQFGIRQQINGLWIKLLVFKFLFTDLKCFQCCRKWLKCPFENT